MIGNVEDRGAWLKSDWTYLRESFRDVNLKNGKKVSDERRQGRREGTYLVST